MRPSGRMIAAVTCLALLAPAVSAAPVSAAPTNAAIQAKQEAGRDVTLATFDVSADICDAILAGDLLFAVDQQPYLQGYLPVQFIALKIRNGNDVGGGQPVYSGPGFVTKENAEQVKQFMQQEQVSLETAGLRVAVLPGGCSGFKYGLNIEEKPFEDDIVMEAAGVRDILTKSLGSANVLNVVKATFLALDQLKSPEVESARRGKQVKDLLPFWERRKND